ncbi:dihydroxyacetone kinase phosphotransfer subunit [Salinarchaeum sp. Harcht-Bsk1]|uniref:dihydroxyacetone kinase phosphoryl donor subunit DhaM n=1 Tax=Salinarchaeum sp. Harcht-Bsk1 TaxID=1333523 RepID=UPI000342489A|nr:dihydroxyacetone kinase phosphoryl donor subunit DhaM [Salinarchaeum sp. Harcht-Bsk1]AGN02049.1 dihydroxyacetone kinase phosphotransfer subunit [Salinarchaeum sp. Harcht-Bsk1]
MIALVVVSHSEQAALGIAEVAAEMGGDARIVPVGGDPDGGIGTTSPSIQDAIERAASGDDPSDESADGVVVLVDLGSAVMNAELAIDTLDADYPVQLADAPILEGALNAAVAAASPKATLEGVLARAEEARDYRKLD